MTVRNDQVRDRLRAVLALLGQEPEARHWCEPTLEWLWSHRMPAPEVYLLPDAEWPDPAAIEAEVRQGFALKLGGIAPVGDVFTLCSPLGLQLPPEQRRRISPAAAASLDRVRVEAHTRVDEVLAAAMLLLEDALAEVVLSRSRLDRGLVCCGVDQPERPPATGYATRVTLRLTPAAPVQVQVGGERRLAYRCGVPALRSLAPHWVEWPADFLEPGATGRCHVLIQAHAIRRLHERVPLPERAVHAGLFASLMRSATWAHRPERALVEYRLEDSLLGYFAVARTDNSAVITDFLLPDDAGTRGRGDRLGLRAGEGGAPTG